MNGHRIARLRAAKRGSKTLGSCARRRVNRRAASDRNRVIQLLLKPISAAENASRRGALTP
jgi:hypothetical protein